MEDVLNWSSSTSQTFVILDLSFEILFVFMSFRVQSSLKHHLHQLAGEVDASFASCAIHGHGMQWGSWLCLLGGSLMPNERYEKIFTLQQVLGIRGQVQFLRINNWQREKNTLRSQEILMPGSTRSSPAQTLMREQQARQMVHGAAIERYHESADPMQKSITWIRQSLQSLPSCSLSILCPLIPWNSTAYTLSRTNLHGLR